MELNKNGQITADNTAKITKNSAVHAATFVNRYGKSFIKQPVELTADSAATSAYEIMQAYPSAVDGSY